MGLRSPSGGLSDQGRIMGAAAVLFSWGTKGIIKMQFGIRAQARSTPPCEGKFPLQRNDGGNIVLRHESSSGEPSALRFPLLC